MTSIPTIHQDDGNDDDVAGGIIEAPATVSVVLSCPDCTMPTTITAKLFTRRTKDSDGTTSLALRTKAPKAAHICGQTSLGLVEGARVR